MPLFLLIRDCQKNFQSMQAVDFFHALWEGGVQNLIVLSPFTVRDYTT